MKFKKYLFSAFLAIVLSSCCMVHVSAQEGTEENITTTETLKEQFGWVSDESGKLYYIDQNGEKLTGLLEIEGDTYYFAPNGAVKYGWHTVDGVRMFFDPETGKKQSGWICYMDKYYYVDSVYGKITGAFESDGKLYYFDENGIMLEGWFEHNGSKYYSTYEKGIHTGNCIINDTVYCFSPKGKYLSGWQTVDGSRIFYDYETNAPVYGWISYNGFIYYSDNKAGKCIGEQTIEDVKYRFSEKGYLETGFQSFDDGVRYYYSDGTVATGFVTDNKNRYYFGDDFIMKTGFTSIDKNTYYFDKDGKMLYGWQTIDKNKYYLGNDGIMLTGFTEIDGNTYYFSKDGSMKTGFNVIDENTYCFGNDGIMFTGISEIDGNTYYFNKDGIMQTGFNIIDKNTYYFDNDGKMLHGWQTINKDKYYFEDDGKITVGMVVIDGHYYFFNSDGIMQTGLRKIDNHIYYFNNEGIMQSGWISEEGKKYYLKDNGIAVKGMQIIDGIKYYFNPETAELICNNTINGITTNSDGIVKKVLLDTPYISQIGYPTGCESASAVMALRDAGYSTSIDYFIDNALDKGYIYTENGVLYGPDPNKAFIGDPRSPYGYGCYAPVITTALNRILENGDKAVNLTGTSLSQLINNHIDNGTPVVIWATIAMMDMEYGTQWIVPETGQPFTWKKHEHCLVLVGYDEEYYYINDPYKGKGLVAYLRSKVEKSFESMGSQSVIIEKNHN